MSRWKIFHLKKNKNIHHTSSVFFLKAIGARGNVVRRRNFAFVFRSFLRISRSCQIQDAPFANFAFKDPRSLRRKIRDTNQEEQEYITWRNFSFLKNGRKYTYRASSILQSNLSWRERRVSPVNAALPKNVSRCHVMEGPGETGSYISCKIALVVSRVAATAREARASARNVTQCDITKRLT